MCNQYYRLYLPVAIVLLWVAGCNSPKKEEHVPSVSLNEINERASHLLKQSLEKNDSNFYQQEAIRYVYNNNHNALAWSDSGQWIRCADSFFLQLTNCRLLGLFPDDYHFSALQKIRNEISADSLGKNKQHDPSLWAGADLLFTDGWLHFVHDVKLGRLPGDSVSLNKDSLLNNADYYSAFLQSRNADSITSFIASLEPEENGYQQLKAGIPGFLSNARFIEITRVPASIKDIPAFNKLLQKRLLELGLVKQDSIQLDSLQLSIAVKEFQKDHDITVDGKAGTGTIRMLNLDDREKFDRIAISMDKYKKLPANMPGNYIWVNASSNFLRVMENGKQKFISRVVTGKPLTRTPMLTSALSALITYPQWVPPPSIILKEILPAVKKNPGYLAKKGFSLLDSKGDEVDPYTVDWTKYNKSIPYKVVQGSGDANALGIIKFYFDNKYAVYLHDTNQRYLFGNAMRNLSHGCVRVQQWRELLSYLLLKDSLLSGISRKDSVNSWLNKKEKRQLALKSRIPIFIRYLTCEGQDGRILFYDDVYGDDKMLRQNYFSRK